MKARRLFARRLLLGTLLVTFGLAVGASAAGAENNGVFSVEPRSDDSPGSRQFFGYTLAPGEMLRDVVSISNLTDEPMKFDIYGTDAFNTPRDGQFALIPHEQEPTDLGPWVHFAQNQIEIAPQTRADIPFELVVPTDATPGDHVGGIAAIQSDVERSQPSADGPTLDIRRRVGARVYLRVEGPLAPAVRVDELDVQHDEAIVPYVTGRGKATITYTVSNTGNIRVEPSAALEITAPFGATVHEFEPRTLPELLPGGSVTVTETYEGIPPLGPLTARLAVEDEVAGIETARSATFWAVPWLLVGVVAAIVAFFVIRWWWRRRRARRAPIVVPPEPIAPREPVGV